MWDREVAFARSVETHDAAAFAEHVHPGAVFVDSEGIAQGRDAIAKGWASIVRGDALHLGWRPASVVVTGDPRVALSRGPYWLVIAKPGETPRYMTGTYQSVWVKGRRWRVARAGGRGHSATEGVLARGDRAAEGERAGRVSDGGDAGRVSRGMARSAPPPALGALLAQAADAIRRGDLARAIATLEEILRLSPDHASALHDLGWSYLATRRFDEAAARLRQAIALRPSFAPTHHGLGLALQELGDEDGAMQCFRRAVQLSPKLGEAHARLAALLVPRGRWEEAATAYRKAYAAAPGTLEGLLCRARGLLVQERRDEAEARLRDLVASHPGSAEAHLLLANVLADTGRLEEAAASYERSLALAPRQATAYGGLVAAKKLTEADRPLLARILARLEADDLPARHRMTLCFAAGKAFDDLNEPATAMTWFDAANAIRKQLAPFDRAWLERRVDGLIARFTRGFFETHASLGEDDETPVLVLGMPRSGTTLVERFVSSHPAVSAGGELVFWNERAPSLVDASDGELVRAAAKTRRDYLALLRGIGPRALRVTDKMPFNFLWIGVIRALFPRTRFVHCRRHPVDTCLSIYQTQFAAPLGFASTRGDLAAYYRQYERLMEHWRSVLPSDRLLEVAYEDATRDPEGTARALVRFCGLPWDDACLRPDRNAGAVKTANKWEARQPVYRTSVDRWRRYEAWLGELRSLL